MRSFRPIEYGFRRLSVEFLDIGAFCLRLHEGGFEVFDSVHQDVAELEEGEGRRGIGVDLAERGSKNVEQVVLGLQAYAV